MRYRENPKTKGSGIVCCIPQKGTCPNKCPDCFFQSGRSYLEPLEENLPNMPTLEQVGRRVVRVNDGNDSNVKIGHVLRMTQQYPLRFYNTAIPQLTKFGEPVVLTVNPGIMTDTDAHFVREGREYLMFVRVRTNTWNLNLVDDVVDFYTARSVPVVLTFMAYYSEEIEKPDDYEWKKRTLNAYWVIKEGARRKIEDRFRDNTLVYTCGWKGGHSCKECGVCLREFFATKERLDALS